MESKVTLQHGVTKKLEREKYDFKTKHTEVSSDSFPDIIIIIIKINPTLSSQGLAHANCHHVSRDGASSRTIRNSKLK